MHGGGMFPIENQLRKIKDTGIPFSVLPSIENLTRMRRELNLSQHALAREAGVSQSLIAKMERGRIHPSYESVKKIYEALIAVHSRRNRNLKAKDICQRKVVSVDPDATVEEASKRMQNGNYSQLPVLSDGKIVGSISEDIIVSLLGRGTRFNTIRKMKVREIMEDAFPQVDENMDIQIIASLLQIRKAVLVVKHGEMIGIITKADLLNPPEKRDIDKENTEEE